MRLAFFLITFLVPTILFADCEKAKLNDTDSIYESYICTPTSFESIKKINKLCIVRAKTLEDEGKIYSYTHMETRAYSDSGIKYHFSTFKWHHKKNDSVSKMWETKKKIKMKDVTATDFMAANIYKISEFQKQTKTLEIEVYKKKALIGLKKRKWYSARFKCQKI